MILQFIILCVLIFLWPLFPPILIPISYSVTWALLIQDANPITLSILSVATATFSTTLIWLAQNHIIYKLNIINQKKDEKKFLYKINKYFKKPKKIQKISKKRKKYIKTNHGKFATFLFTIVCYLPIIPDIITTRILYKKIKFPYFLLALIIGKSITHIPFIFFWKGILTLIKSQF